MDHYFSEGGLGTFQKNSCTAKTAEKKSCKGSHGEKIKVLSTIQILCLTLKNILAHATAHKKNTHTHNLKERKNFMPQKIAQPFPQKK